MASGLLTPPTGRSGSYAIAESSSLLSLMSSVHTIEVSKTTPFCLISVLSPARVRWDLFILVLAVWSCFYVPFSIAFLSGVTILPLKVSDLFLDAAYIIDVFVFARSSYLDLVTGEEVTAWDRILLNYAASGKLAIDLVSAVPFDVITWTTDDYEEMQLLTLSKIIRLLRLLRLSKILMFAQTKANVKLTLKLCQLLFLFVTYLHVFACLWYMVTSSSQLYIPPALYVDHHPDLYSSFIWRKYAYSLYMSVYMLVGAEIGPRTPWECIFAGSAVLSGQLFQAYMFGEIAVVMFDLSKKTDRLATIQDAMTTTMANVHLSTKLQRKIVMFFTSMMGSITLQTEYEEFFAVIPPSLQQEVRAVVFEPVLLHNSVLHGHMQISASILHRLSQLFCHPELEIVSQGAAADHIYFISKGNCLVTVLDEHKSPHQVKYLREGALFGEVALVFPTVRTATVQSVGNCVLAVLSRADFNEISARFPRLKSLMKRNALRYTDSWKLFLLATLHQCPYFSPLSNKVLSEICYSLPVKVLDSDQIICELGSEPSQMLFILEGQVDISVYVNDARLKMLPKVQNAPNTTNQWMLTQRQFTRVNFKPESTKNKVKLILEELGPGSVLFPLSILTGDQVKFTAKTKKLTVALVISKEMLTNLTSKIAKLQETVANYRSDLMLKNTVSQHKRNQSAVLDYKKRVISDSQLTFWNAAMKVKRCIISKIMEKRTLRAKGFSDLSSMSKKLKALQAAEESKDQALVEKLRRGVAPESQHLLDAYKMLGLKEVENPLLTQFAVESAKVISAVHVSKRHLQQLEAEMTGVERTAMQAKSCLKDLETMMKLALELQNNQDNIKYRW